MKKTFLFLALLASVAIVSTTAVSCKSKKQCEAYDAKH